MLPRHDKLTWVLGNPDTFSATPLQPFSGPVCGLLADLSARLFADRDAKAMPDVVAFAYWCRKANLERQAQTYADGELRMGRGLAFHVTPTNTPVNFAFSWVFALLSGNANVVRLPNRDFPQVRAIVGHVEAVFKEEPFRDLAEMNAFVTYGREEEITASLSAIADVRIIWGGDETIRTIRKAPLPARGLDIGFADRYSFCVLGAAAVLALDDAAMARLASGFYNDTYLMDQNACSSPRLVVWLGTAEDATRAGGRFWSALQSHLSGRYALAAVSAVDKLTQFCRDAIELDGVSAAERTDNRLFRLKLESLVPGIENRRGNCGYFYEYATENLDEVAAIVTTKYQTLTYEGVSKDLLSSFIARHRTTGIDRIVPVGAAMDIGLVWDGYDLLRTLSRVCQVR